MCIFSSDDRDEAKVWVETPRRAAKEHHCTGCGAFIRPGETYLDHRSFSDYWYSEAACFWCWWSREMFVQAHSARQYFCIAELERELTDCIDQNDNPEDGWRPVLQALLERNPRRRAVT